MSEDATSTVESEYEIQTANRLIFDTIKLYIKGRCLEVQSGTNSFCQFFIDHNRPIHLSDSNPQQVQHLKEIYQGNKLVRQIHEFDLKSPDFKNSHPDTREVFDTVIALQLLRSEFPQAVDNIKFVLPQDGILLAIAPAYTAMYGGPDQNSHNWKRYNSESGKYLESLGFSILKIRCLNLPSMAIHRSYSNAGLSAVIVAKPN